MMGNDEESGLVPRTIQHVFDLIEQHPDKEYLLRLSMLEIYNEVGSMQMEGPLLQHLIPCTRS